MTSGIKLTFEYELGTTKVIRYVVTFRNNNNMPTLNKNFLIKIWVSNSLMNECSCQRTVELGKEPEFLISHLSTRSEISNTILNYTIRLKSTRMLILYMGYDRVDKPPRKIHMFA